MTVVGVASVRSCGVTTLATGLAMVWPSAGRRLVVEADPAGGTLAATAGLPPAPGLVSLAAAARRSDDPERLFEHCQSLPGGALVLCAPPGIEQTRSALGMLAGLLGRLGELEADVFVDCGRLGSGTPALEIFESADLAVLAARPQLADLHALAALLEVRDRPRHRPTVVLVGPGPYPPGEVADALEVEVAGQVPWDPEAAQAMTTIPVGSRQLTRTPLVRALRSLADDLGHRPGPPSIESPLMSPEAVFSNGRASSGLHR
jgi:MinD-like ATPase involved in chromosome partitioning or flagellar assembly